MNKHPNYIIKVDIHYNDGGSKYSEDELFYENKSWTPVNKKLEKTIEEQGLAEGFLSHTELYKVYRGNRLTELIQLNPKQ